MGSITDYVGERDRGCFVAAILLVIPLAAGLFYITRTPPSDEPHEVTEEVAYDGSQSITETVTWNLGQTGDDYALNDVFSPGTGQAWFAGDMGTIYYTPDGGKTFEKKDSGTTENLDSIWFLDDNTGFAAGSNGAFVKTKDGGKTWVPTNLPVPCMRCIYFMNSKIGYAVGNLGTIYRTEDGGETWTQQDPSVTDEINSVVIANTSQAYFTTADGLYGTTDGGKSWSKVLDTPTPPTDVVVDSAGNTWLVGHGYIYRSTDGKSFEVVESAPNVNWAATVANGSVWTGGNGGALYRTDDEGSSWQQEQTGTDQDVTSMHRNGDGEIWTTHGGTTSDPEPTMWTNAGLFQFGVRVDF